MTKQRATGLLVTFLFVAAVPASITIWDSVQTETKAPDFRLTDTGWEDGVFRGPQEFALSDFRGDTVIIDFMAYNCPSCKFVTPVLEELHAELHNESLVFLTIDVGEFTNFPGSSEENLIKWQTQDFNSPWRHALDTDGIFLDYIAACVGGIPCIFIIGPEGDFLFQNTGVPSENRMREIIASSGAGTGQTVSVISVGILGLAMVAGIASFFAPCSVDLIPAYMGFLLQRQNEHGHHSTIPAGLQTAAGIVSLYAVLAAILWIFQDALAGVLPWLGPVVGAVLVVLGLLLLLQFDWERVAKWFGMGKIDGRRGFFAFGVGYGLAAFGCTGPIFLPILVAGFAQGATMGLLAFGVYAIAVAAFVVLAAYLVGAGQQTRLRNLLSHTKGVTRVSAALLILAGAYLIWFDVRAFTL